MSGGNYIREDFNDELNDLELGLEKEKQCIDFYRNASGPVADAQVQALYRWFVEAGEQRLAALQSVHAATAESESWAPEVREQVEAADVSVDGAPAFDVDAGGSPGQAEIMSVRQAVELEKEAVSIYHTAVRRSRDKNVREMWRYLAATEEAHKRLLDSYFEGIMQVAMKKRKKKAK